MTLDEWNDAQRWLEVEASNAYIAQRGNRKRLRHFVPPEWLRKAVDALGSNDIERFKYIRIKVTLGETFLGDVA